MKRDITKIKRDLDDKRNNDIILKKFKMKEMFEEDPDIKEALGSLEPRPLNKYVDEDNPTEEELKKRQEINDYNEKIKHDQIVPFLKLNGLQKEVLNFIMYDFDDIENYHNQNDAIKKQYLTVMCVVHENSMETEYDIVRTDLLSYLVKDLLSWTNALGFHLVPVEDRPMIIDTNYYCRRIKFMINTPNVVRGHGGKINKYDQFTF